MVDEWLKADGEGGAIIHEGNFRQQPEAYLYVAETNVELHGQLHPAHDRSLHEGDVSDLFTKLLKAILLCCLFERLLHLQQLQEPLLSFLDLFRITVDPII